MLRVLLQSPIRRMNLDKLPADPEKRLEAYQQARRLSEERERASKLMARYEEGLEDLSNEEWTILAFTPPRMVSHPAAATR